MHNEERCGRPSLNNLLHFLMGRFFLIVFLLSSDVSLSSSFRLSTDYNFFVYRSMEGDEVVEIDKNCKCVTSFTVANFQTIKEKFIAAVTLRVYYNFCLPDLMASLAIR